MPPSDAGLQPFALHGSATAVVPEFLARAPFSLGGAAMAWVAETHTRLSRRRRLAQLFNVMLDPFDARGAALAAEQPGGITQFMIGGHEVARRAAGALQAACDVPLLVSADVEGGAATLDGSTPFTNALGLAAVNDAELHAAAVRAMAIEAREAGIRWAFAPVLDINAAFRSAIVATRSYGSDPDTIVGLARRQARVLREEGLAATAKHWPGEGHDDRDQHLLTTVNPLEEAAWQATHGRLYRALVDDGVPCVMSGHIALPALARRLGAEGIEAFRPASVSSLLNRRLLRGELGFNGVVVSDASEMAGLGSWAPREVFLPELLANGCDMVLFSPDLGADLDLLERAIDDGRLDAARVDEALWRVLGLKALLGLHRPTPRQLAPDDAVRARHAALADAVAGRSITLVKDVRHTLPLDPHRHLRVVLVMQPEEAAFGPFRAVPPAIGGLLAEQGFSVRPYDAAQPPTTADTDLVLFVLAGESLLTRGHVHLDWARLLGPVTQAMARWWHHLPCVLVSLGHPYYLYDAPRMPCVVNAYCTLPAVQRAVVQRLLGHAPFTGSSPVDPFCSLEDARH